MLRKIAKKYQDLPVTMKASIWFLFCSFVQKVIAVITTPIFTRVMTTAEYGAFNVFVSWQGILSIFVSLNLSSGVYSQGLVKYESDRKIFSASMQGLSAALALTWLLVYDLAYNFWNQLFALSTMQMISMFFIIWSTAAFEFWASEQRVEYRYKTLVIITLITAIVNPIIGIFFVSQSTDKVSARIISMAIVSVCAYTGLCIKQIWRGKSIYSQKYWINALKFNIPLIPHYLSQTVLNSADRIMIKYMVSESCAGIYSLAYSISLIMTLFNTALMQTFSPWIYKKINDKKIQEISKTAYPILFVIAILNLILIAFAPEAVAVFAPESYYDAIWIIPPVAMSVYFMFLYDLFAKFSFFYENTRLIAIATGAVAVLNVILNFIFIERFGYWAAGYTTLVSYIFYAVFHYILMWYTCKKYCRDEQPYSVKKILCISGVFVSIGFFLLFLYRTIVLRYILILAIVFMIFIRRKVILTYLKGWMHQKSR